MQNDFVNSLLESISVPRFSRYQSQANRSSDLTSFSYYLWNVELSESLYPALQGVEIALRNSIHNAATTTLNNNSWFDAILLAPETKFLENVRDRLMSQSKNSYPDNLVAALSFGFWVSLFHNRYERILWPQLLREVFPYMPRKIRTQGYVYRRLRRIRNLRNRVFHYEPVWHWPDLAQHHQEAQEVIGWINPDMLSIVKLVDRFPEVYRQGPEKYQEELLRLGSGNS